MTLEDSMITMDEAKDYDDCVTDILEPRCSSPPVTCGIRIEHSWSPVLTPKMERPVMVPIFRLRTASANFFGDRRQAIVQDIQNIVHSCKASSFIAGSKKRNHDATVDENEVAFSFSRETRKKQN